MKKQQVLRISSIVFLSLLTGVGCRLTAAFETDKSASKSESIVSVEEVVEDENIAEAHTDQQQEKETNTQEVTSQTDEENPAKKHTTLVQDTVLEQMKSRLESMKNSVELLYNQVDTMHTDRPKDLEAARTQLEGTIASMQQRLQEAEKHKYESLEQAQQEFDAAYKDALEAYTRTRLEAMLIQQ